MVVKKIINTFLSLVFAISCLGYEAVAYSAESLPLPNQMLNLSVKFDVPVLRGLKLNPDNPFDFQFIVDSPNTKKIPKRELERLFDYFLTSLTLKEEKFWVNLSPNEKDRIIDDSLVHTQLGKDMLAQDYLLKQLSASLTDPESPVGNEYWKSAKNYQANKIWIESNEAELFEHNDIVVINEMSLKVTAESQRYRALFKSIENDVNTGKNFLRLRQIHSAFVLAAWFKDKFVDTVYDSYINENKLGELKRFDVSHKYDVFSAYLKSYRNGVYNKNLKVESATGRKQKRNYSVGGVFLKSKYRQVNTFNKFSSPVVLVDTDVKAIKNSSAVEEENIDQLMEQYNELYKRGMGSYYSKLFNLYDTFTHSAYVLNGVAKLAMKWQAKSKRQIELIEKLVAQRTKLENVITILRVTLDKKHEVFAKSLDGLVELYPKLLKKAENYKVIKNLIDFNFINHIMSTKLKYNNYNTLRRLKAMQNLVELLNHDDLDVRKSVFEILVFDMATLRNMQNADHVKLLLNELETTLDKESYVKFIFDELLSASKGKAEYLDTPIDIKATQGIIVDLILVLYRDIDLSHHVIESQLVGRQAELNKQLDPDLYDKLKSGLLSSAVAVEGPYPLIVPVVIDYFNDIESDDRGLFSFWEELFARVADDDTVNISVMHKGQLYKNAGGLTNTYFEDAIFLKRGDPLTIIVEAENKRLQRLASDLVNFAVAKRFYFMQQVEESLETSIPYRQLLRAKNLAIIDRTVQEYVQNGGIKLKADVIKTKKVEIPQSFNIKSHKVLEALKITIDSQKLIMPSDSYLLFN